MKTICVLSLESINNAGDEILGSTTKWLIEKAVNNILDDVRVVKIELYPKWNVAFGEKYFLDSLISRLLRKIERVCWGQIDSPKVDSFLHKVRYWRYFKHELKKADSVILALGMLKYKAQAFSYQDTNYNIEIINRILSLGNIPLMMSAMSIADPDEADWRYNKLVFAANMSAVKMITTRDGIEGENKLKKFYIRSNIQTDYVGDPALWIPECYGVSKKEESDLVGIGLVRKDIFDDYSEKGRVDLLAVYVDFLTELTRRGVKWVLFCNGIESDYAFGQEIVKKMNLPKESLLRKPQCAEELINDISQFSAVFGARLHACITAVSLGIPVTGMLWDPKLYYFAKTMKILPFFTNLENMNGKYLADRFIDAMNSKVNYNARDEFKERTYQAFYRYLNECGLVDN